MSGAEYFDDGYAINAHMDDKIPVDVQKAITEHAEIQSCFEKAGIEVVKVDAPVGCQDAVYTANWGLVRDDKVVMSNLPNIRQPEEEIAIEILKKQGKTVIKLPPEVHFSGQGDALPCGDYLFVGTDYRTSPEVHGLLQKELGFNVIGVKTVPQFDKNQNPVINPITGWPDSFFYDLDLAIAVIKGPSKTPCPHDIHTLDDSAFSRRETERAVHSYGEESAADEKRADAKEANGVNNPVVEQVSRCDCRGLIAWCPEAFMPSSQELIRNIKDLDKIEVSLEEAMNGFACNLVSTGESIIMSNNAPELQKALTNRGLRVYTPNVTELSKGGGFIRCTSLTL